MSEVTESYRFEWGARCNIEQYRMLQRCSKARDVSEWNTWRAANEHEAVWLAGADLHQARLNGAILVEAHLEGAQLWRTRLEKANLLGAHLDGAQLWAAHLENAWLQGASLAGAHLRGAHLENARLWETCLRRASLSGAHLAGADLPRADLTEAVLEDADLQQASLRRAFLDGTRLVEVRLQGADFTQATVDGRTLLSGCLIDKETDFSSVGLDAARIEPGIKQLLEYNVRRKRWLEWYDRHENHALLVRPFWWMSDYGRSTGRIIGVFFGFALGFAVIYYLWGLVRSPGLVTSLFEDSEGPLPAWLVPIRALYFSVVTMTTLGFGDIHAVPRSAVGHLLLVVQVLMGYVLLGAMVTRFAVLFEAGGPAGIFTKRTTRRRRKKPSGRSDEIPAERTPTPESSADSSEPAESPGPSER